MKTRYHPRRRRARSLYPTHEPVAGLSLASRPRTCPAPKARLGGSLFVSRPGSLLARRDPGLHTKSAPPKRAFGAGQVRGLDAKESPATGSWVGYKDLARLRRG